MTTHSVWFCICPYTESEDYTPTVGSLIFTPLDFSKRLSVVIREDSVVEQPERLFVALTVPDTEVGVSLMNPRRVAITIIDDDSEHALINIFPLS